MIDLYYETKEVNWSQFSFSMEAFFHRNGDDSQNMVVLSSWKLIQGSLNLAKQISYFCIKVLTYTGYIIKPDISLC